MHGVVGEAVGWPVAELEPGVATEDIKEVVLVARVEYETAARQRRGRVVAPGIGCRLLITHFELDPDDVTEKVAEPPAAPDLLVEHECAVIARVGSESADFELMGMLGDAQRRNRAEIKHQ